MHTTRGAALLAAAALTVSGLAACGDEGEPSESSSTASPSAVGDDSSTDSSASESGSTSASGENSSDSPDDFPASAKKKTKEGAAAFGKFYFLEYGEAAHTGDTSVIESIDSSDCLVCSNGVEEIEADKKKGFTRSKNPYTVRQVQATKRPDEGYKVSMKVKVAAHHRLDSKGEPNGDIDATSYTMTQHVVWENGQWQMANWVAT